MKIEIHLLQNVAPSCLNRDDTNTPKSCEFGGVSRARISSQSWKRAVREFFREENSVPTGTRTKQLQEKLLKALGVDSTDATGIARVRKFIEETYSKMDGSRPLTKVLVFISDAEVEEAANCIREGLDAKAAIPRLQSARRSADIALFGRMLAEIPGRNIDAACQVAHAVSTHAVNLETDFYTAVDDMTEERDETGAGMLGTQGFNSACFYRYALIDQKQLVANLGDPLLANQTIAAFLKAFTLAIPTAKQNSHAAQNPPSFGLFVARDKGVPVSLANAFASPIYASKEHPDIIGSSIHFLDEYQQKMQKLYGLYSDATLAAFCDRSALLSGEQANLVKDDKGGLDEAIKTIMARVSGGAA